MTDDFERRFKDRLSQEINAELGGRREPPPFRPSDRGQVVRMDAWRRRPWVLPLLAAACVALIVGGTAGAVNLLADNTHPVATDHPSRVIDPTRSGVDPLPSGSATRSTPSAAHSSSSSPSTTPATSATGATSGSAPPTDTPSSNATSAQRSSSNAAPASTTRVVVRPVHADGTPVAGYRVRIENEDGFTCAGDPSPVAVDADIRWCGSSAVNTLACWKSTNATVLCLRDATTKLLVRIPLSGRFTSVAAPARPEPQIFTLASGATCTIRNGGAGETPSDHPSWVAWYYCDGATVYGPLGSGGIDTSGSTWTVHVYQDSPSGPKGAKTRNVAKAYLVGTAG